MGNKIGKLGLIRRSKESDRQPLLKSDSEEGSPKEKKRHRLKVNKYQKLSSLKRAEQKERQPLLKHDSEESSTDSWHDNYSMANYLAELSDLDESPVENQEARALVPPENIESEDLAQSSNAMKELLQDVLSAMSNSVENIPLENLKKKLSEQDTNILDLLMKVSKELKNISVPNSAWKNLMELLVNGEYISENPEATSGFQNISAESLFSLSVYSMNCYLSDAARNRNRTENPLFRKFILPLLQEEGASCLNITRYNSERKRILDITLFCKEITNAETKFVVYLWESKDDKWRLVGTPYVEMSSSKCFAPPNFRAEGIPNQRMRSCKCKSLPQPTPSADLPIHIEQSLEGETRLTAYNSYLEKKLDVTLAQGKKHEHETEFYIEWTTDKKVAYSFTAPNDAEPTGQ